MNSLLAMLVYVRTNLLLLVPISTLKISEYLRTENWRKTFLSRKRSHVPIASKTDILYVVRQSVDSSVETGSGQNTAELPSYEAECTREFPSSRSTRQQ
jgi:hypothetical protein